MSSVTDHPMAGQRLGDFEIVREVGRGGMGVVYEARQLSLNRKVALKVLSSGLGLTPKAVQRFHREAEAAARLHHTNIVPIYATGEENDTHFYAMELIEGPSLDKVIGQLRDAPAAKPSGGSPISANDAAATGPYVEGASPPAGDATTLTSSSLSSDSHYFDTVSKMLADVAEALDYAHKQGVIHRDIKPSNLLLSPDGRLSINDFGLARLLEQPGMTVTGEFVGTPVYMSPEQITAGRVPLDQRTDVYSLGVTLYELLAWQPPFRGERRDQVLAQIIHKEPKPPRKLNRKVPVDLETICLKAMDKDPDRRYPSAGAMADDLRRYVNRFAILARRTGPVTRLTKWVKRHPGLAAALACLVVLGAVAIFLGYQVYVAEQQRLVEREQHEKELLVEKRQAVLERALLAARGGELDGAEKAIGEAELLGASAGQVRMIRGQVAFYRGDTAAAVEHAEQAVKLLPDNVAARGLLASAYARAGQFQRHVEIIEELQRLTPLTPEDYLFKGYAESVMHPARALQAMDEAIRRRDSVLARIMRADVRADVALDTSNVGVADLALQDANVASEMLGHNPNVRVWSFWVRLVAASVYEATSQLDKRQAVLAHAERDIQRMEQSADSPKALWCRVMYLDHVGQRNAAFELMQRHSGESKQFTFVYAAALYQRGDFQQALEVLDRGPLDGNPGADVLRVYVLAELPDGPARALQGYKELAPRYPDGLGLFLTQTILRLLGRKSEAVAVCREFRQRSAERFFAMRQGDRDRRLLDYNCELISAEELLRAAQPSKAEQCAGHYYIALNKLAEGERAAAREHFQKSVATRWTMYWTYEYSRMFLARMERDPNWPPWISVKKD